MKRVLALIMIAAVMLSIAGCAEGGATRREEKPQIVQMRAICNLAVLECYFHNVGKYFEEDADKGFLGIGKKDKHFWVEYSAVVKIGVDATLVTMTLDGTEVKVTLPPAKVLSSEVDSKTLNMDSFIVASNSAKVTAEDESKVHSEAKANLESAVAEDTALLFQARERVKMLIEEYIRKIGKCMDVEYKVTWVYVDVEGKPIQ